MLTSKEIIKKIDSKQFEWLLEKDQLRQVMSSGEAFSELTENKPNFKPSYKFFVGSSDYDPKYVLFEEGCSSRFPELMRSIQSKATDEHFF